MSESKLRNAVEEVMAAEQAAATVSESPLMFGAYMGRMSAVNLESALHALSELMRAEPELVGELERMAQSDPKVMRAVKSVRSELKFYVVGYDSEKDMESNKCYFIDSTDLLQTAKAIADECRGRYSIVRVRDSNGNFHD